MARFKAISCPKRVPRAAAAMVALAVALLAWASGRAEAATIISEDFNRANGTVIAGTTPDLADLPGGVFTQENNGTQYVENDELQIGPDVSVSAYLGSYNTGVVLVSADVSTGNTAGPDSQLNRGVGLGFNAQATGAWNTFSGLRLTPSGNLLLEVDGVIEASVVVGTAFSGSNLGLLSYDVNFTTGAISNISLQGSSANFSSIITASQAANYFSADDYVSVFGGGATSGQYAYVDNLLVSNSASVPEPRSIVFLSAGIGLIGVCRRRAATSRKRLSSVGHA